MDYSCQTDVKFNQGSIININSLPLKQWADEILFFKPDILGFSVNLTNMTVSLLLAAELKKLIPGIFIVFGGPNAAQDREGNIILHTRIPDIVVHGEGEETLLEITKILENHGDFSAISSIGFLKNN